MGNSEHIAKALSGVAAWNVWRAENPRVQPDLTRINLSGYDLRNIDFRGVGLFKANLSNADLRGAVLRQARLIKTDLRGADLTGAFVYGVSVWDAEFDEESRQRDLVITEPRQPILTVDSLEMAQFIHLIVTNRKLRQAIDTITSKAVLILGRFTRRRKAILDRLKETVRQHDLLPIVFDFTRPQNRDMTETVQTLAYLAKFTIADLTEPKSVPHEIQAILPTLSAPLAPIILEGKQPYSMFPDQRKYPWLLEVIRYKDEEDISARVFPKLLVATREKLAAIQRS